MPRKLPRRSAGFFPDFAPCVSKYRRNQARAQLSWGGVYIRKCRAPQAPNPRMLYLFQIFAGGAAAELERLRTDKE